MRIPLLFKFVIVLLLVLLAGFVPFAAYLFWWKRTALPHLTGNIAAEAVERLQFVHYVGWGLALSLSVGGLLWFVTQAARPLRRLHQVLERMTEGDYRPLPNDPTTRDELGDLHRTLNRLARHLYEEAQQHSAQHTACTELVRMLPCPVALLDASYGPDAINAAFRQATSIDKATELNKFHILRSSNAFVQAVEQAQLSRTTVPFSLRLPWLQRTLSFQLCPIPSAEGKLRWALVLPPPPSDVSRYAKETSHLLNEGIRLLTTLAQRDPAEFLIAPQQLRFHVYQLRVIADLVHTFQTDIEEAHCSPTSLERLLDFVQTEAHDFFQESNIQLERTPLGQPIFIVDADKRVEHVLRSALLRVLLVLRGYHASEEPFSLSWAIESTETQVHCGFLKLPQDVECEDLDQLLAPLGGSVTSSRDPYAGDVPSGESEFPIERRPALWLHLRRA